MLLTQPARPTAVRELVRARSGLPKPIPWATPNGLDALFLNRKSCPKPSARTISVVVPSWNSERTLVPCVESLVDAAGVGAGTFDLEIIVVDDGSTVSAAEVLRDSRLANGRVEVRVAEVDHAGQSRASNTGALLAQGELLVFCDSDMVLHPWALSDLHRASSIWADALCFGFREDVSPHDPRIRRRQDTSSASFINQLRLANDNRLSFDMPGVPSNLIASTTYLGDLQSFRRIRPPGRDSWWLARMAYGCLVAVHKRRFLDLGGFDGRFTKWGFNDTEFATRWIANGGCLIPVFTANGYHVRHGPRHPAQWRNAGDARVQYEESLADAAVRPEVVAARVRNLIQVRGSNVSNAEIVDRPLISDCRVAATAALLGDRRLFEEAVGCPAVDALRESALKTLALRVLRLSAAPDYLDASPALSGPFAPDASLEAALLALALGERERAKAHLEVASSGPSGERATARYLLHQNPERLARIARWHLEHGLPRAAASGLLASQLRFPRGGQREPSECLLAIDACDRRIF